MDQLQSVVALLLLLQPVLHADDLLTCPFEDQEEVSQRLPSGKGWGSLRRQDILAADLVLLAGVERQGLGFWAGCSVVRASASSARNGSLASDDAGRHSPPLH